MEIFTKLQAAVADVKAKSAVRDTASNALDVADKDWKAALEALDALRKESSDFLDALRPVADPRFRKSA